MSNAAGDVDNSTGIEGGTDGAKIGNVGDRLKVDTGGTPPKAHTLILPFTFGETITSPAYPAVKPLHVYRVPTGKTLTVYGARYRTSAITAAMMLYTSTILWKQAAVALATPVAPTTTQRTYTGAGLTLLAVYRYKIVAVSVVGTTLPGPELVVTMTTTNNANSLAWAAVTGAVEYLIFRTSANGATNTQKYLQTTLLTTYTDVAADARLDVTVVPPVSNTTAGSVDGAAYPASFGSEDVVVDTLAAITAALPLDILYTNALGELNYATATPGTAVGSQTQVKRLGESDPVGDNRILPHLSDIGRPLEGPFNDIVSVGNNAVTGSIVIYGRNHYGIFSSDIINHWQLVNLPAPISFVAGTEIFIGTAATPAITAAARQDLELFTTLE